MRRAILLMVVCIFMAQSAWAARAKIESLARDPYLSALVIDGDTGKVLVDENSAARAYPASVLKMMVLLVVLEKVEQGSLALDEIVQVTPEAARMGGSQVYLDPKEQFPVEDLLYALMIQSANDAAVALATHVSGSKDGFVALMNKRAAELGMKNTRFYSVHGLPPSVGQEVDVTTAGDLAILARELAGKKETFKYTGTREREFRNGEFIMRTHNHLLTEVDGCDGFKTGYFKAAGFSIVATARRNGVRIIAVVLGSKDRKVRDAKAAELLAKGFSMVPAKETAAIKSQTVSPAAPARTVETSAEVAEKPVVQEVEDAAPAADEPSSSITDNGLIMFLLGVGVGLIPTFLLIFSRTRRRPRRQHRIM